MTDHAPLTDDELAEITLSGPWEAADLVPRLIADLRASRAELAEVDRWGYARGFTRRRIAEVRASRGEVERLRAALVDAAEEMQDMVGYVPDYFRQKWKYDEAILRAKAAAS